MLILNTTLNKQNLNHQHNNNNRHKDKGAAGFTLLEILVALILVVVVLAGLNLSLNPEDKLNDALNSLERSIRYATSEAVLRHITLRIHLDILANPSKFKVEYNENKQFLMQKDQNSDKGAVQSLSEEEEAVKKKKKMDSDFLLLPDTKEEELGQNVQIIAFASTHTIAPITEGDPSLYIYPIGEKDESMILIAYKQEIAALFVEAFSDEMARKYYIMEGKTEEELNAYKEKMIKEIYDQWKKGQIGQ